jgi:hypothetical protein
MDKPDDWETVSVKSDKVKISNENIYILSELINNGACLRCLSNNCHLTEKHGIFIPDKIKIFIKNPQYISEIKKVIDKEENIMKDIEELNGPITPIFTTCGFTHSKKGCRNCVEGRMKKLSLNNDLLTVCYSQIKHGMSKITFGLHIDIKLILKDKNYQVSAIPANIILPAKVEIASIEMNNKDNFPTLENSEMTDKKSFISKNSVWNTKLKINPEIIPVDELLPEQNFVKNQENNEDISFNSANLAHLLLLKENDELKMEINELNRKIKNLEKKSKKDEFIFRNAAKFEEIINNIDILNIVSKQVLETEYSEYILY